MGTDLDDRLAQILATASVRLGSGVGGYLTRRSVVELVNDIAAELRRTRVGLDHILAACQQLSDEETKILRSALAWDVEDVKTAKELMEAKGAEEEEPIGPHRQAIEAHQELDRVSIERTEEGAVLSLPHRVAILAGRYVDEQRRRVELDHAGPGEVPAGTKEIHVVTTSVPDRPESMLIEIEDQDGRGLGNFERRQDGEYTRIVIPYGRDDAWVTEVAYQAAGAASGVFLREDGEKVMPSSEVADAVAALLEEFGIPRACSDCRQKRIEIGQRSGKTERMRQQIREDAATPEDAEAAIREMEGSGRAFMDGAGHHIGTAGGGEEPQPQDDLPTDDAEEPENGPFSGSVEVRVGPDGYPWISILSLIGLLEKLGCATYRDEEVAEPGAIEEVDQPVPLWKTEILRALDHSTNAIRSRLGL